MHAVTTLRHVVRLTGLFVLAAAMVLSLSPAGWAAGGPGSADDRPGPSDRASATAHERADDERDRGSPGSDRGNSGKQGKADDSRPSSQANERATAEDGSADSPAPRSQRPAAPETAPPSNRPRGDGKGGGGDNRPAHAGTRGQEQREAAREQREARAEARTTDTDAGPAAHEGDGRAERQEREDRESSGNAGSVKVNPVGWQDEEQANPPRNHPHLDCVFDVNFYGFYGDITDVQFTAHPPSAHGIPLEVEPEVTFTYDVGPPPGNTLVETHRYDLTDALTTNPDITRHPQQGYHVKVETTSDRVAPGNRKHKVFWVDCPDDAAVAEEVDAIADVRGIVERVLVPRVEERELVREDVTEVEDRAIVREDVTDVEDSELVRDDEVVDGEEIALAERPVAPAAHAVTPADGVTQVLAVTGLGIVAALAASLLLLGAGAFAVRRSRRPHARG